MGVCVYMSDVLLPGTHTHTDSRSEQMHTLPDLVSQRCSVTQSGVWMETHTDSTVERVCACVVFFFVKYSLTTEDLDSGRLGLALSFGDTNSERCTVSLSHGFLKLHRRVTLRCKFSTADGC